jgi:hypothetical protein
VPLREIEVFPIQIEAKYSLAKALTKYYNAKFMCSKILKAGHRPSFIAKCIARFFYYKVYRRFLAPRLCGMRMAVLRSLVQWQDSSLIDVPERIKVDLFNSFSEDYADGFKRGDLIIEIPPYTNM